MCASLMPVCGMRVNTPDGKGTIFDHGGGMGNTPRYVSVDLDNGGVFTGRPSECEEL